MPNRNARFGSTTQGLGERDAARHVATKTVGSSLMGGMRGGHGMRNWAGSDEGGAGLALRGLRKDSHAGHIHTHVPRPPLCPLCHHLPPLSRRRGRFLSRSGVPRRDENSAAPQSPLHHYPKKSIRHNCLPTNTHPPQPRAYITTPLLLLPPINWRYGRFLSRRGVPRRDENSAALRLGGNVLRLECLCPAIGTLRLAIRNPSLPLALAYSISSQKKGGFRLPHHSDTFAAYFCESFSISSFAFFLPIS